MSMMDTGVSRVWGIPKWRVFVRENPIYKRIWGDTHGLEPPIWNSARYNTIQLYLIDVNGRAVNQRSGEK